MAIFYDKEEDKVYLKYIDLTLGVLCVLLFLTSTPLNLIIIGFYRGKKNSHSAKLHTLLGGSYLLGTILLPLVMAFNFFRGKPGEYAPEPLHLVACGLAGVGINSGACVLTVISVTRLYSLKYPLRRFGTRRLILFTSFAIGLALTIVSLMFAEGKKPGSFDFNIGLKKQFLVPVIANGKETKTVRILIRVLFIVNALINILVCGATGYVICPRRSKVTLEGANKRGQQGSVVTIFYMNLVYTFTLIYITVNVIIVFTDTGNKVRTHDNFHVSSFIAFPFLFLCVSAFNPLVMISRGKQMREYAMTVLTCRSHQVSRQVSVSRQNPTVSESRQ